MKIIRDNCAYIEQEDLRHILRKDGILPRYFLEEFTAMDLFDSEKKENNGFITFERRESIKYINSLDYIVDYDKLKKMSITQLYNLCEEIEYEKQSVLEKIRISPNKLKTILFVERINDLIYMYNQVDNFIESKKKNKTILLPNGINDNIKKPKKNIFSMVKDKIVAKENN